MLQVIKILWTCRSRDAAVALCPCCPIFENVIKLFLLEMSHSEKYTRIGVLHDFWIFFKLRQPKKKNFHKITFPPPATPRPNPIKKNLLHNPWSCSDCLHSWNCFLLIWESSSQKSLQKNWLITNVQLASRLKQKNCLRIHQSQNHLSWSYSVTRFWNKSRPNDSNSCPKQWFYLKGDKFTIAQKLTV